MESAEIDIGIDTRQGEDCSPLEYAVFLGNEYASQVDQSHKKGRGQFFTPPEIASFMASKAGVNKSSTIRILDPGCGTGILSFALVEELVSRNEELKRIFLTLYETDVNLIPILEKIIKYAKKFYIKNGVSLDIDLCTYDFILENYAVLENTRDMFELKRSNFDYIISNPPYFKLNSTDDKVLKTQKYLGGHSNVYSLFMSFSARMLAEDGDMIFITPRSFASGKYFENFRNYIFGEVVLDYIHIFESRRKAFDKDNVLQELIITKFSKKKMEDNKKAVLISHSYGISDLNCQTEKSYPTCDIVDLSTKDKVIHVISSDESEQVLSLVSRWNNKLSKMGIKISTGPVVSFRLRDFLEDEVVDNSCVPLIWMHHVNKMNFNYSLHKDGKKRFIHMNNTTSGYLTLNRNMVLLRRFSSKDDEHRLIATPYYGSFLGTTFIGIENKLNYIYKINGEMTELECVGLSSIINSRFFDLYFRTFNGNVNVSSTEFNFMKFPSYEVILAIGQEVLSLESVESSALNKIVEKNLDISF